jgi:hypothetical protein
MRVMCFSATGSFVASAMLVSVGVVSLATNRGRTTRMLSLMPLLFGVQQFAEGMVWLTIGQTPPSALHNASVFMFLSFALVVWPTWLPLAMFRAETHPRRRRHLKALLALGLVISLMGASLLVLWRPLAHVADHSIHYDYGRLGGPFSQVAYLLVYVVPTVIPFFVGSLPLGRTIGGVFLFSLATTLLLRQGALASTWCFFASLISVLIVLALRRVRVAEPLPLPVRA